MNDSEFNEKDLKLIDTLSKCEDVKNVKEYYKDLIEYRNKLYGNKTLMEISKILEAFAHPDRIMLLKTLLEKDRCVCEIEIILNKSQPTVSYHLKILEKINLIRGWKKGKFTHYSVVKERLNEFKSYFEDWTKWMDAY